MSWGIFLAGGPVDIKATVDKDANIPEAVKALTGKMLDAVAPPNPGENVVVTLNSSGHFDIYGGNASFEVKRFVLVEPAPAVETAPAPASPS